MHLKCLKAVSLTANRTKNHIGSSTIQYLVFRIGSGKIWAVPDKVATLQKLTQTQTKKKLECLLGLANYD